MKPIDKVFTVVAAVIQFGIAVFLLWAGNTDSLKALLASSDATLKSSPEVARLLSDYRDALGIAREIFVDVGIALLCSFGLTMIVFYRQVAQGGPSE